jgi:hypothetical protein
LIGD